MILGKAVPPKLFNKAKRIALVVDLEWLARIDEFRKRHGWPPPTVSDSVRQLVDIGLDALANGYKPKPKKIEPNGDKPKPKRKA
jgi:hypothetical protein